MWKRIMPDLPSGTVTFLFTDIEGSTALWKRDRQAMVIAADGPGRAAAGAPRVAVVPAGTRVHRRNQNKSITNRPPEALFTLVVSLRERARTLPSSG
jgi:hypothetical protein